MLALEKKVLFHMCGEQIQGYHLCQESCDISRLLQSVRWGYDAFAGAVPIEANPISGSRTNKVIHID
jgi:hypothetical protein